MANIQQLLSLTGIDMAEVHSCFEKYGELEKFNALTSKG
jgi:hypothetical protein